MEHCGFFFSAERLKIRDLKIKNFFRIISSFYLTMLVSFIFQQFQSILTKQQKLMK